MPREQLLGLAADVDRLLAAGVMAGGSEALQRRAKTLRELGKKVPALVPIADGVERVTGESKPARAFLDLMVMTRQVRGSLAATGVEGTLTKLSDSGPWQTPVPVRDLQPVYETLTESGSGREDRIKDALERNLFGDLRLVSALFEALHDVYAPVADAAANKGLPALGHAVLAELESKVNLDGKVPDARRLRAICRIDANVGATLCRQALTQGNATLRAEALALLPDVVVPDEAEETALQHVRDKNRAVRVSGLTALRSASSDEALDILFKALEESDQSESQAAVASLGSMRHPDATKRLLEDLRKTLALPRKREKGEKKAKSSKKSSPTNATDGTIADPESRAQRLVQALGDRDDGDLPAVGREILSLMRETEWDLQNVATVALGTLGPVNKELVPGLIELLEEKKGNFGDSAVDVLEHFPLVAREAALPALVKFIKEQRGSAQSRLKAMEIMGKHGATHQALVLKAASAALADSKIQQLFFGISQLLAAIAELGPGAKSLLPEIFDMFRDCSGHAYYGLGQNSDAIARIDPTGKESIPKLIEMLKQKKTTPQMVALDALGGYGARAREAIPAVEQLTTSKDWNVRHNAERTLEAIR
jgi:HEAT repeat protein